MLSFSKIIRVLSVAAILTAMVAASATSVSANQWRMVNYLEVTTWTARASAMEVAQPVTWQTIRAAIKPTTQATTSTTTRATTRATTRLTGQTAASAGDPTAAAPAAAPSETAAATGAPGSGATVAPTSAGTSPEATDATTAAAVQAAIATAKLAAETKKTEKPTKATTVANSQPTSMTSNSQPTSTTSASQPTSTASTSQAAPTTSSTTTAAPGYNPVVPKSYPAWSYAMKLWPFDILYPFATAYAQMYGEQATSDEDMDDNFQTAYAYGANTVICYIDDEQSYETFVSEEGFAQTLARMRTMVTKAHAKGLKLICYLNGLEVVAVGATTDNAVPSLAKDPGKQDWLQQNIGGAKMVWYTGSGGADWVPANSEDAWASPYGPWRSFFKSRVISLAQTGLDGLYIDAAALPGMDNFGEEYASSDPYFAAAFKKAYGLDVPAKVDWNSQTFRKFVYFRHETIRDYLSEMKQAFCANAKAAQPVVFFEMSANDTESGTYLGNDNQFTISGGIACSPEVEPAYLAGGYSEGFRGAKATRDADQGLPMLFLGWPTTYQNFSRELAITLCLSNNFYPTANGHADYGVKAFKFINSISSSILARRVSYQNTALIYPMRSKDNTFDSGTALKAYNSAFLKLEQAHIPFRIVTLETLTAADLAGIGTVVLAGASSISDAEYRLLNTRPVVLLGENGTRNEWGTTRAQALAFSQVTDLASLQPGLPFNIAAPATSYIEYYVDQDDPGHYYLFVFNSSLSGSIQISQANSLKARVYGPDVSMLELSGTAIDVPVKGYLTVIDLYER